jgi:hypothetical protein
MTRYGSLEGPVAKVGRAAEHYRVLKTDFSGGFDRKYRTVSFERHRDGLEYRLHIGELEPIHPEFVLVLGDAYFNLRSALDQLAFQLHVRHFRGVVPAKIEERSAFPILDRRRKDKQGRIIGSDKWREIQNLSLQERTAIEWMQPYHRWYDSFWSTTRPRVHHFRNVLHDVNWFNRIDKHRRLHVVHSVPASVYRPQFDPVFGFTQHPAFGVPLESHAHIDTWRFLVAPPPEQVEMQVGCYTAITVEKEPGLQYAVIENLGGCIHGVARILMRFGSLFPPTAAPVSISWVRTKFEDPPH